MVPKLTFAELAEKYCSRQVSTPEELLQRLKTQQITYKPDGWMLLECQTLDSSRLGEYTVLPYGPYNTFRAVTTQPISPRGLASDMAVAVGYCDSLE